ncbi:MAG: 1-(5-phosphoribosyl)-5-[(5-phosphoribosylamino)methylideneamino]imidazole-4-carboxamide isomerase [Balneolaceae bacterium]|nr:1-(5-phosphoribosyl)-5-[(5-phosphoribosylamino)methylideneamino]imidazole-4-carboxamide isomerase [Balneolaceae bacterium]
MIVIPAIDLLDGQVVRLKKGSYDDVTVYNDSPLDEARKFDDAGFSHIHIVDLDGAKEGRFVNLNHIEEIKKKTALSIQTGGGIRSYEDGQKLLKKGVSRIICSSLVFKKPDDWKRLFGESPAQVVLGMDLKDGQVAYGGWLETANESINSFLQPMIEAGLRYVLCTDIARDGMLEGVNIELYQSLQAAFPQLSFIASGGVASVEDFKKLADIDAFGVVVGRAYYENRITLEEMAEFNTG